jgi:hypothetical protein
MYNGYDFHIVIVALTLEDGIQLNSYSSTDNMLSTISCPSTFCQPHAQTLFLGEILSGAG